MPSAAQRHDDIEKEIDRLVAPQIQQLQTRFGDVSPEAIAAMRAKERPRAEATVDSIHRRELAGEKAESGPPRSVEQRLADIESVLGKLSPSMRMQAEIDLRSGKLPRDIVAQLREALGLQ
jgi:hypothetical protein